MADLNRGEIIGVLNTATKNLRGANLAGVDLSGLDLSGVDLAGANLAGCNLRGAKIDDGTKLAAADLSKADLRGVTMHFTDLEAAPASVRKAWQTTGIPPSGRGIASPEATEGFIRLTGAKLNGARFNDRPSAEESKAKAEAIMRRGLAELYGEKYAAEWAEHRAAQRKESAELAEKLKHERAKYREEIAAKKREDLLAGDAHAQIMKGV